MRFWKQLAIGAVVLGGAAATAGVLVKTKPKPQVVEAKEVAQPVRVHHVTRGSQRAVIRAGGTVRAQRVLPLASEVMGRLVSLHPNLHRGGVVKQGEVLVAIDPRNYAAAVTQAGASLHNAQLALRDEQAGARAAEAQWADAQGVSPDVVDYATRKPHLAARESSISAAKAGLDQAKRNLAATKISAPFDAVILDETVEANQLVTVGTPLGTIAAVDRFRVEVSLPYSQLQLLKLPDPRDPAARGSTATVAYEAGNGVVITRRGQIERVAGAVDEIARTTQVLVEIEDPMGLHADDAGLPLLIGTFVDVTLDGREVDRAARIPMIALRGRDQVWIVDTDDTLRQRTVQVLWRDADSAVIGDGLVDGDRVVAGALPLATEGMKVRALDDEPAASAADAAPVPAPAPAPAPTAEQEPAQ